MYIPPTFAQTDLAALHDFIDRYTFGLLVHTVAGEPFATHLPFLLDRGGPFGALRGHMAAANPQARQSEGQTVLAVFSGPHAYVSPTWYGAENVVPTWNYLTVHAYGTLQVVDDEATLAALLRDMVAFYEGASADAWAFDPSTTFARKLLEQIVGFRIVISRLEGKWKLSQNQPAERRAAVEQALRSSPDETARSVADWMAAVYRTATRKS